MDDEIEVVDEFTLTAIDQLNLEPDLKASWCFQVALEKLKEAKPNNRSEIDRRYAITITEFEKVIAYYDYYVLRNMPDG